MKLIVKKDSINRDFYNELLYISSKHPNLVRNPNLKVHSILKVFALYLTIGLLLMILFLLLLLKFHKWILIVILFFMSVYFIMSIYFLIDSIKFTNKELKENADTSLTINNSGVRITKEKRLDYKIDFKDIMYVLINKHTIVFLPINKANLMIGIPSKYKKEIIKELTELKKDDLIIDNSKLYK